ncbi:phosphate/phosphite/phosphonate ABC transporter substrate-binding protein [Aquamicrobium segne]|uniref:Phosphate/phosphite/phosphonate ABC transporter substrate-binding protein n=1 Tax=Aquamicrobium segne TaxID=469547 RepID=A0ABW0H438_9HYPH
MSAALASLRAMALVAACVFSTATFAQDCTSRGDLNDRFCDMDGDELADPPTDPAQWLDPDTLIFSYTPVEDPAVYEDTFSDLLDHLAQATGKKIKWFPADSYAAEVEAMRSGRLHIAGYAAGAVPYAVNLAGFHPAATMDKIDGSLGYRLKLIVPADSDIKSVEDLKGKRVAHVAPSSNSGDTAPKVLFKQMGVVPGTDYEIIYSGKHDNSILGVVNGDYDAAPIADSVLNRMIERGLVDEDALRIVYESRPFPRTGYGFVYNLKPELAEKIVNAFLDFDFMNSSLFEEFKDTKGFTTVNYKEDWENIVAIQRETGASYDESGLSTLKAD